jgi:small-conductance mechanosensitive channel
MLSYTLFEFGPYNVCFWNILALFVIFLIAAILRRIIHRSLKKYLIGANISLEGRRVTRLKLVSQSVYVLAVYLALLSFQINNENVSISDFLNYQLIETKKIKVSFYQILMVLILIVGAKMLVNSLKLYFSKKFRKEEYTNTSKEFIYIQISKYIVYIFTFFFILQTLNVDLTIFLGGSAAILVGLGLGLQDVFKDMFSGLVLLFEGTIKINDVIEFQDGKNGEQMIAKIKKINVRTTHIETRDGNVIIIPNTKLTQEPVENWSHGSLLSRFLIDINVAYGSDTELVCNLLKQAAMAHPKVKKTEPVLVRLTDFGERGLKFQLIFWADQSWEVLNYKSEIRFEIDRLFRQHNVQIPFPQREITIHSK